MALIRCEVAQGGVHRKLIYAPIPAGHPEDASDLSEWVDLNEYVSLGSDTVLYFRVKGESMADLGIADGDLLIADHARSPKNGDVIIAELNGTYTVKKFVRWERKLFLVPENKDFKVKQIFEGDEFRVCAVVTFIVHRR